MMTGIAKACRLQDHEQELNDGMQQQDAARDRGD
jgi:hypothetical protein